MELEGRSFMSMREAEWNEEEEGEERPYPWYRVA